jgi:hypothetical protein
MQQTDRARSLQEQRNRHPFGEVSDAVHVFIAPVDSDRRTHRRGRRRLLVERVDRFIRHAHGQALVQGFRVDAVAAERSPVRRRMLAAMRTATLRAMLERTAFAEDAARFARQRRSRGGREKIVELFPSLRGTGSGG